MHWNSTHSSFLLAGRFVYTPHPSQELTDLFAAKPYQGVAPERANFLFVGLDANYHPEISAHPIYPAILAYHADGVGFWQQHGVHHPFLLPGYTGDGRRYHQNFAHIGFTPEHAPLVSFIEVLHVPTVGRNVLVANDLSPAHLQRLNTLILEGSAPYIFIPRGVAHLMRATGFFPWLPKLPTVQDDALKVWFRTGSKTVYSYLHFSNYGKFTQQMAMEAAAIQELLTSHTDR